MHIITQFAWSAYNYWLTGITFRSCWYRASCRIVPEGDRVLFGMFSQKPTSWLQHTLLLRLHCDQEQCCDRLQ